MMSCRNNSSSAPKSGPSVPIKLISELRSRRPGTPLSTARTALASSDNDVAKALDWLEQQAASTGAAKQAKLASREAKQGLVGVSILADGLTKRQGAGVRAAIVELRCETDFVARTDEFKMLAQQIANSVAYFAEPLTNDEPKFATVNVDDVNEVPVVPAPDATNATNSHVTDVQTSTVRQAIQAAISRLGENITLHRVTSVAVDPIAPRPGQLPVHVLASYLHGSSGASSATTTTFESGTLAGLVLCRMSGSGKPNQQGQDSASNAGAVVDKQDVHKLARALARQVVALPTTSVMGHESTKSDSGEPSTALYDQTLMTMSSSPQFKFESGASVKDVLEAWSRARGLGGDEAGTGFNVVDLKRWQVGEPEA
ncbi:Elongation factor Ts, mitochondrial [Microbotryomycetes sp. JL221]|nr:Elongation factor Ts, mitochondrial [Microbotryomycetes sp. JL221]